MLILQMAQYFLHIISSARRAPTKTEASTATESATAVSEECIVNLIFIIYERKFLVRKK